MEREGPPPLDQAEDWADDPVLGMLGVGEELWADETGDTFVRRARRDWEVTPPL